jgi:ABC-2 type transport system permease protein
VVLLVLLGSLAFAGLAMLMAGTLRAEATLGAANLVYVLLLVVGGAVVPVERYPQAVQPVVAALPSGALGEGMRAALVPGGSVPWWAVAVLAAWAVVGMGLAARYFRWE